MSSFFYHTIRARVRNPYLPVDIATRLPLHLRRIVGIQCRYCSGIERIVPAIAAEVIPRIGWFTLAANNRKRPLGVFDVRYERPWVESSGSYQEIDVPIQGGSMITGTYNNELRYHYGNTVPGSAGGGAVTGTQPVQVAGGLLAAKVNPVNIRIVNPASAMNYDGYIVAIYLKCMGDMTLKT